MSAVARLRTRSFIEDLEVVHTDEPIAVPLERHLGLALECEMIRPPSSAGKRIRLVIPPAQQVELHRILRDEMRRQRMTLVD